MFTFDFERYSRSSKVENNSKILDFLPALCDTMSRNLPPTDPSSGVSTFDALVRSLITPLSPGEIRDDSDRRTATTSSQDESLTDLINPASLSATICLQVGLS